MLGDYCQAMKVFKEMQTLLSARDLPVLKVHIITINILSSLLAPQSGALRRGAFRNFHTHPIHVATYSQSVSQLQIWFVICDSQQKSETDVSPALGLCHVPSSPLVAKESVSERMQLIPNFTLTIGGTHHLTISPTTPPPPTIVPPIPSLVMNWGPREATVPTFFSRCIKRLSF